MEKQACGMVNLFTTMWDMGAAWGHAGALGHSGPAAGVRRARQSLWGGQGRLQDQCAVRPQVTGYTVCGVSRRDPDIREREGETNVLEPKFSVTGVVGKVKKETRGGS